MDIILLGVTIVSLIVAFVMSVTAIRLARGEKQRSAARVAALLLAAGVDDGDRHIPLQTAAETKPLARAPGVALSSPASPASPVSIGFLSATEIERDNGGRQKTLAFAAVALFLFLSSGLVWMMSGPRGTTSVAVGPNSPLELVSLTHERQSAKLAVSGLVRNPPSGKPLERLSAVVFLFDRTGTFVSSSRANVDFLKLGAGDESPFVVSLDAPQSVARYRVSFRTDEGIVPHVDRREAVGSQESTVKSLVVSQQ